MNPSQMPLALAPKQVPIPIELVRVKQSQGAAFSLACDASGLDDKDIAISLGIDTGYFSNMRKGKATLNGDLVAAFCRVVGNTIYLEWLAFQVGCTLMMIQTEAERQRDLALQRAKSAEDKLELLTQVMQGKAVGVSQ